MVTWLIVCLIAGCFIDTLHGIYTRACANERPYLMTTIGAMIGFFQLTVFAGIIQQGLEKGLIYICFYAIGNWFGGLISFKFNLSRDSVPNKKPTIIET